MYSYLKKLFQDYPKLRLWLPVMLIVQLVTCITQVGFYHPDQHFQVIEFSSYQLHTPNAASHVWEMTDFIRPTLQVYLFSVYYIVCNFLKIADPYLQLTILRIILGLCMFCLFNLIAVHYLRNEKKNVLYFALFILNLSWLFPYIRTLYSSEILSSLFFFGGLFLYDSQRNKNRDFIISLITGFLFSLSFYCRFQMGFAIVGFGFWMVFFEKKYSNLIPVIIGFITGSLVNTYLDYHFYHELIITPYSYFHVNINQGKAASFGTSSFIVYVGVLAAVLTVPPLSLFLIYYLLKSLLKKYNQPLFITVIFFIIGHCFIGHKEERFLFPVLNAIPVLIGWGLPGFINYYSTCKKWIHSFIKSILYFSIGLNILLLVILTFNPYSQTVHFSQLLKDKFETGPVTIYCVARTPFETESGLPLTFYQRSIPNIELKKITQNDSIQYLKDKPVYIVTTYNQIVSNKSLPDNLGYKPILYSSKLLWNINEVLSSEKISTINDIWVLYQKEK